MAEELGCSTRYWRAANYLSVGQIYLLDNPLLREPLRPEHVKPRLLGHWGTTPGPEPDLRAPEPRDPRSATSTRSTSPARATAGRARRQRVPRGHLQRGLPATSARDEAGLRAAVPPVLVPGRDPEPRRARDAGLDPRGRRARLRARARLRRRVRQPRPARRAASSATARPRPGPLAAELALEQVPDPASDGAVLPILHLNGYKIANPTVLARIPEDELRRAARGLRLRAARSSTGDEPDAVHQPLAAALDEALDEIARDPGAARDGGATERPRWPMIVLRTPKGWTGPKEVDGLPVEGTWRVAPGAARRRAREPEHLRAARGVDAQLPARGALRRATAGSCPSSRALAPDGRAPDEREPARERRRCCCATSRCPTSATTPSTVASPATTSQRGDARARRAACAT